jgi:membrane protein
MSVTKKVVLLLTETWEEFQKDEATERGAALAYYAMFSIFPLLILLLAALGFVTRYWDAAVDTQREILTVVAQNFSPQLSAMLGDVLSGVQNKAGSATGIGILTLLIGASGVFQELETSFAQIWNTPLAPQQEGWGNTLKVFLQERLFSFGMMLALGLLLLISLALTGITQALIGLLKNLPVIGGITGFILGLIVTCLFNTCIFALLFKYLPKAKVEWRDVLWGAFITAVVWEIAKRLLALYIAHSSYVNAYGAVGTALVLMAWVYFSSQVLFLGAEFTEVYSRYRRKPATQETA